MSIGLYIKAPHIYWLGPPRQDNKMRLEVKDLVRGETTSPRRTSVSTKHPSRFRQKSGRQSKVGVPCKPLRIFVKTNSVTPPR